MKPGNTSMPLASIRSQSVVGIDGVRHLVEIAREKTAQRRANLTFQHFDIGRGAVPGAGNFDVLVSMHTLYWHPQPTALLEGCRRALRAGGARGRRHFPCRASQPAAVRAFPTIPDKGVEQCRSHRKASS